MIARNSKDIIFFILITLLTISGLVYGFTIVPSPIEQRDINFDKTRVNDLNENKRQITDYYQQQYRLPDALTDTPPIDRYEYASNEEERDRTKDPETGKQYDYKVKTTTTYQLCATFNTDTTGKKKTMSRRDEVSLARPYFGDTPNFSRHTKGYQCFEVAIPKYLSDPKPSPQRMPFYDGFDYLEASPSPRTPAASTSSQRPLKRPTMTF